MQITADFVEDVRRRLSSELETLGYKLAAPTGNTYKDARRVCVDHWNAYARRIPTRPRAVHRSRELQDREPRLEADLRTGLASVEQALRRGDDLTSRLSRKLGKRAFNDKMLNDWGIHHLHLGSNVEGDGFTERTDDVLFLMVREDDAYLLDVRPHGAWADDDFIEIVHTNWPSAIEEFRLSGIRATALTTEQWKNLRAKSRNAAVGTKDGTVYAAIGGGLVSSGSNIRAIRWGDYMLMTAQAIEKAVTALDADALADEIRDVSGVRPDRLELRLGYISRDHALVLVANAARPFGIKVPIADAEEIVIDLRPNADTHAAPGRSESEA